MFSQRPSHRCNPHQIHHRNHLCSLRLNLLDSLPDNQLDNLLVVLLHSPLAHHHHNLHHNLLGFRLVSRPHSHRIVQQCSLHVSQQFCQPINRLLNPLVCLRICRRQCRQIHLDNLHYSHPPSLLCNQLCNLLYNLLLNRLCSHLLFLPLNLPLNLHGSLLCNLQDSQLDNLRHNLQDFRQVNQLYSHP